MERQSEQELLAIVPVETESLEGNRIYQVTGRELTQIAEISAREAVKMCREERKKTEKREQSNADKVKRTKKLLSDYRRLKREIPENEEFTEGEKVEKRWAFLRDLMGSAHINSQESVQKVIQWGSDMVAKGRQAASDLCSAVINGVANLPSQMANVGYNIVMGVWNGICNAAGWFRRQVQSFFSGIVDGVKGALGIHSPSKVFADEIGKWIPPGIGVGIEAEMPDLYKQMDDEMASLGKRMQTAVNVETGKIAVDKKVSTTYKVEKEKQGVFESGDTTVEITGETHVHVDLDGREVGDATTPIVDENMARIDTHKKRGG